MAKIITVRLQRVIATMINEAQSGLILGRKIADNIILATTLVKGYQRKYISPRCMVKIDLQKTYDSVEWVYLEQVQKKLCFLAKFINWIMQCVKTVSYSININGELNAPFTAAKGLRQGDPISPYLFAVVMEYLSRLLSTMKEHKDYSYHLDVSS